MDHYWSGSIATTVYVMAMFASLGLAALGSSGLMGGGGKPASSTSSVNRSTVVVATPNYAGEILSILKQPTATGGYGINPSVQYVGSGDKLNLNSNSGIMPFILIGIGVVAVMLLMK